MGSISRGRFVWRAVGTVTVLLFLGGAGRAEADPFAYIPNSFSDAGPGPAGNTVSVIDVATNRVVATLPWGIPPRAWG